MVWGIVCKYALKYIENARRVVNSRHGKDIDVIARNRTVVTSDKAGWKGLGIGKWYLDSLMSLSYDELFAMQA